MEEIKQKVRDEIKEMFHELYSGVTYPRIDADKVDHFVERALNMYETKMYYEEKKNEN